MLFTYIRDTEVFLPGQPLIYCCKKMLCWSALYIEAYHWFYARENFFWKYDISVELVLVSNDPVMDCSFDLLSSQVCRYWNSAERVNLALASGLVIPSEKGWDSCMDGTTQIIQIVWYMQGMQSRETSVPPCHMAYVLENLLVAPHGNNWLSSAVWTPP